MHLLLASQRLEEGKLRGLDSHLSYRIGLKTFSAGGVPRGARRAGRVRAAAGAGLGLPQVRHVDDGPVQGGVRVRRRTAPPAAGRARPGHPVPGDRRAALVRAGLGGAGPCPRSTATPRPAGRPRGRRRTGRRCRAGRGRRRCSTSIVGRLRGQGPPAHEVWLPPLDDPNSLDALLPPLPPTADRGLSPAGFSGNGRLAVPVGADRPAVRAAPRPAVGGLLRRGRARGGRRRSAVGQVDAAAHAGHVGAALTHTAERGAVLRVDLGGGTLAGAGGAAARRRRRGPARARARCAAGGRGDHAARRSGSAGSASRRSTR